MLQFLLDARFNAKAFKNIHPLTLKKFPSSIILPIGLQTLALLRERKHLVLGLGSMRRQSIPYTGSDLLQFFLRQLLHRQG